MSKLRLLLLTALPAAIATGCASFPDARSVRELAEKMVAEAHPLASPELRRRQVQDRSQQICSAIGTAKPSPDQLDEVVTLARASIRYPDDGRLMGDWKTGAQLVVDGAGQRIVDEIGRAHV